MNISIYNLIAYASNIGALSCSLEPYPASQVQYNGQTGKKKKKPQNASPSLCL
jgi:hypothetical protein